MPDAFDVERSEPAEFLPEPLMGEVPAYPAAPPPDTASAPEASPTAGLADLSPAEFRHRYEQPSTRAQESLVFVESIEQNKWGTYAILFAALATLLTLILWPTNGGAAWPTIAIGAAAIYYGMRGRSAAQRALATNGRMATIAAALGLVSIVTTVVWLVISFAHTANAISRLS